MPIIDLDAAKSHLNVTTDADDAVITIQIAAAELWIGRWLPVPLAEMEEVPADLRQAVLMLVGHWYENREATIVGVNAEAIPFGVQEIIDAHREWSF